MSTMAYMLAGGAMGLGQGITKMAEQNAMAKREMMLEQLRAEREDARAQRDRGWQMEDRQDERAYEAERTADERSYAESRDDVAYEREREMARLNASLRPARQSGGSGAGSGSTAMTTELEYLAGVLARSRGEELSDQHRLEAVSLRNSASRDRAAAARAQEELFRALMEDRRDRRSIEEKWEEAGRLAGVSDAPSGPPTGFGAALGDPEAGSPPAAEAPPPADAPPASTSPPARSPDMPRPQSREEYEALPSGTVYMAPDGTVRTKP